MQVSIVIPVLNDQKFTSQCIDSIKKSTDPCAGYYSGIGITGPSIFDPTGPGLNRGDCAGK